MPLNDSRFFTGFVLAGFMLAAAGCQSGDSSKSADLKAPAGKVLESELRAYCPYVSVREGTSSFTTYQKGGESDPAKIIYQASISEVTRSCSHADGKVTMNVGVAGRVVPGPAGKAGTVTMPIRIAVVQGDNVLYSNLHKHQVTVGNDSTQWVFNDPNVTIPISEERNVQIFAGYDEGPPKKKAEQGL